MKETKTALVKVVVTPSIKAQILEAAWKQGEPYSVLVREAINVSCSNGV